MEGQSDLRRTSSKWLWDLGEEVDMGGGKTVIYRGGKPLGVGAGGVVYPCVLREVVNGVVVEKEVAVKCEIPDLGKTTQVMVDKLNTWSGIPPHENVVELYAGRVLESHESHFLSLSVTERMGCNLKNLIHEDEGFARTCTYGILVGILQQVCKGLAHLHKNNIIHFDIKPSNVLISKGAGGKIVAKLADFGDSKAIVAGNSVTQTKRGTPAYMAPEVFATHPFSDSSCRFIPAVDVYSLGVLMWEVLNRKYPSQKSGLEGEIGYRIAWSWIHTSQKVWCEAPWPLCELVESCMSYRSAELSSHNQGRPSVEKVLKTMNSMKTKIWWKDRACEYKCCQESGEWVMVEVESARSPPWQLDTNVDMGVGKTLMYRGEKCLGGSPTSSLYPCILREIRGGNATEKRCAVKYDIIDNVCAEKRESELKIWGEIPKHANILKLYAGKILPQTDDHPCTALSIAKQMHMNLRQLIFEDKEFAKACTYGDIVDILEQICLGLTHLHKEGFIHHDIKLENVLIYKLNATKVVAKICGFGWTRKIPAGEESITAEKLGSPVYMAPEIGRLGAFVDPSARVTDAVDVFSFGVLMWMFLNRGSLKSKAQSNWRMGKTIKWPSPDQQHDILCMGPDEMCNLVQSCLSFESVRENSMKHGRPSAQKVLEALQNVKKKSWATKRPVTFP